MGAIGLGLFWFGYCVAYYGYDQVTGGNNSFLSLLVPGKYANAPKDTSGPGLAPGGSSTVPKSTGNPGGAAALNPTSPPAGQSGQFAYDQNGDLYKMVNGKWTPWGSTAAPVTGVA